MTVINALSRHIVRLVYPYVGEEGDEEDIPQPTRFYTMCVLALIVGLVWLDTLKYTFGGWRKPTQAERDEFGLPGGKDGRE